MNKEPLKKISSKKEFFDVCDEIAVHKIGLATAIAERDRLVQEVLDKYDHSIQSMLDTIKQRQKLAEGWATKNKQLILHGESRSGLTALSVFAFRTGQPTIKPKGRLRIADIVKDLLAAGKRSLVRVKTDLDKDAAARLTDDELDEIGLKRVQVERFSVEPRNSEKEEV